jgi:predicted GNAT superfamily acetyltransferase
MGRPKAMNHSEQSVQPAEASADSTTSPQADNLHIAKVTSLADYESCVEVQLAVWGYSDGDLIPKRVFIVADSIGGQVIGAFDRTRLVGFAMALPGYRDGKPYLHSHMLAVLPEYRNAGLGRRLKLAQREDAVARGFDRMEWTFDPLEIKNAHLNIARLGAIVRRYLPDFYGPSTSPLQGGLPTDRLVAEWWLRSSRVHSILSEEKATNPLPANEITGRVCILHKVYDWKRNPDGRNLAKSLQTNNRLALESAFAQKLAITGYERSPDGDGCFLIGPVTGLEDYVSINQK